MVLDGRWVGFAKYCYDGLSWCGVEQSAFFCMLRLAEIKSNVRFLDYDTLGIEILSGFRLDTRKLMY